MNQLPASFKQNILTQRLWQKDQRVLIAVSTGVDSMVLLDLCRHLPADLRPKLGIAYVDHHLRAQSQAETTFIQAFAQQLHLPLYVADWPKVQHPKEGIEAAARAFRYAFFAQIMAEHNYDKVLTAHHGDDLAETILMKLMRSGDLPATVGLPVKRPFGKFELVRPLLNFSKAQLYAYAKARHLVYFEDVTNQADTYLRNRLRHQVLPKLKQENAGLLDHTQYFSQSLASLLALQATLMPKLCQDLGIQATACGLVGAVGRFQDLGANVQLAYLQGLWQHFFKAIPLKAQQAQGMLRLLNGQKPQVTLDLEGDLVFKRVYDRFFIQKNQTLAVSNPDHFQLELNHWQSLPDNSTIGIFEITSEQVDPAAVLTQTVTLSPADFPITVRRRQPGDRYQLPNGHHGKVKKLLIDRHVPSDKRDQLWLVFAKDNLIWIPTFRFFQLFQTTETDRIKFMLCFKQNR